MKGIIGMTAAAIIVVLQLVAVAALQTEAELHLAPVDGPAVSAARPA
jgi:hypothetical protein